VSEPTGPCAAVPWSLASLFATLGAAAEDVGEPLDGDALASVVAQARAGDDGARRRLYLLFVDRVYRTVRSLLRSDADAEDVTQDAMLTVLTSLHRYTPRADARFAAWVMTIALNTARRRYRRRRPDLTASGVLPDVMGDIFDPVEDLDRVRRRRALLTALAELAERERVIVTLRYGGELTAREIGAIVGLEAAAVRKVLERTRTWLGTRVTELLGGKVSALT
jgi:RNA polymerase sigma-70 factor (ECF subfamily)